MVFSVVVSKIKSLLVRLTLLHLTFAFGIMADGLVNRSVDYFWPDISVPDFVQTGMLPCKLRPGMCAIASATSCDNFGVCCHGTEIPCEQPKFLMLPGPRG